MLFTKVYKEEDVRLRGCSYNVASVYFHLKNKRDYFKKKNNGTCYDLIKYISEYMGISESTIKRAIATLKELGLIEATIKGKVNHYSFPILEAIERGETPQVSMPQQVEEKPTEELKTPNKDITHMTPINDMDNMETTPISTDDIEEEFETEEQKYGSRVMDFVDRYYDILENIVKAKVINTLTPTAENSLVSQSADIKLKDLVIEYGFTDNEKPHLIQLLNDWRDEVVNKQNEVVAA